jgi:hypothetical protein
MLFQHIISKLPYKQWLLEDKENKQLFWLSLIISVISFTWLKIIYPYPNFMPPDSYSYLAAAQENKFINMWPIGYSKFLRLVSIFSQSHMALVISQYILLQFSTLYCLSTIRFLLSPGKWPFRIIVILTIANPLLPHIANFISSDCLFASLSLVWFTQLLWIIHQPNKKLLLAHSFILLLAFSVRFTALYYPFFSIAIILIKPIPQKTKWLGIGTIALLLLLFIGNTQYEYKRKTKTIQYSAFGGWQIASNALYGYAYAKLDNPATMPYKFRELHTIVNHHMDSIRQLKHRPDNEVAIYYLWNAKSPLHVYMKKKLKSNKESDYYQKWVALAPLYQQYGRLLIQKHPLKFIKYYIWPNLLKYYSPPPKFMGWFNMGRNTVDSIAVTWFGLTNNKIPSHLNDQRIYVVNLFPTLLAIINPMLLFAWLLFVSCGGLKKCTSNIAWVLSLQFLIWLSNSIFSILSAPNELRYQVFPIIITVIFCGLFLEWIVRSLLLVQPAQQLQKLSYNKQVT